MNQKYYKDDQYARIAQSKGLRSRSWFKLDEINRVDSLFCIGMTVVDLGSAPGGWSLYAKNKVGITGRIIACDILPMRVIMGVKFIQGNCSDSKVIKILYTWVGHQKAQVLLSDMSPNITGISIIDINRSMLLGELALEMCSNFLRLGGSFVVKIFQGKGFDEYVCDVHSLFNIVKIRKPKASRTHSREVYIVAKQYNYHLCV